MMRNHSGGEQRLYEFLIQEESCTHILKAKDCLNNNISPIIRGGGLCFSFGRGEHCL